MQENPVKLARVALLLSAFLAFSASGLAQQDQERKEPSKDVVVELLETTYRLENDGTGEITQAARLRTLTLAGRDAVAQSYFAYSSQLEDLRIDYFRTVKRDGTRVDADPTKAADVASPVTQAAPVFSDVRVKAMVAPKLEVGDALEYQFMRTIRAPLKTGDFWALHYQDRVDVVEQEIVRLDLPQGRSVRFKADPDVPHTTEQKSGRIAYRWQLSNPKPSEAGDQSREPLFMVSTLEDWKQVGEWYVGLQAGRLDVTSELKLLAEKLTSEKKEPRDKVEAIYSYVSESIRYVALEFGIGGYQAHRASDVLRNGYGDCKDKAGLLTALLAAAGLKAYPALVRLGSEVVEPSVPMPSQFNHVISAVPLNGQLLWLDPTLELAPMGLLPSALRGKQALVVEPGNSHLESIPEGSPVPEEVTLLLLGKLDVAGKLTLDSRMELRGSTEVVFRKLFRLGNQEATKVAVNVIATLQVPGATAEVPESSDPTDLEKPFTFRYKLTRSGFFGPLDKSKEIVVPHALILEGTWQSELAKVEEESKKGEAEAEGSGRQSKDLKLGEKTLTEESFDLELDPSYQVEVPLPVHVNRSFASYDSTYRFDHGHVKASRSLRISVDKLPRERWRELASFQKVVDADLDQKLVLQRRSSFDVRSQADSLSADELNQAGIGVLEEQGDFALARDLLLKATQKDPKHKWAWNNLGRAYLGLGMIDEAERAFQKQIEVSPEDEYAHANLGRVYVGRHQYEQAIAEFQKQLEINPLDRYTYPLLARTYSELNRWDDAVAVWKKAIALERDKPDLYVSLGHALIKAGKTDEAREQFDLALEKDRTAITLNNVAWELADNNLSLDKAEELAKSAVGETASKLENVTIASMTPEKSANMRDLGSYLDTLGWVFFQKGRIADSEPYLVAACDLSCNSIITEHLGRVRAHLGDADSALRLYACSKVRPVWTGHTSPELEDFLVKRFGNKEEVESRAQRLTANCFDQHRSHPEGGRNFTWPEGAQTESDMLAHVAVLVDERGSVIEAEVLSGEEPFRTAALLDARKLRFSPLVWPGETLKTVRTITFAYSPEKEVNAFWLFGRPPANLVEKVVKIGGTTQIVGIAPQLPAVLQKPGLSAQGLFEKTDRKTEGADAYTAHLKAGASWRVQKNLGKAITEYREAVRLDPGAVTAHRALADALAEAGQPQAAIIEYREVARLDPNDAAVHFMLGTRLEMLDPKSLAGFHYDPKTHQLLPPKGWKPPPELEEALQEYKKACELAPDDETYKVAFERVAQRLNHR